jgi:uncharacterized protein YfaP (DUF2135 family)
MNLLSLLIAPLQAVVLFFAPHAGAFKPTSARSPVRSQAPVPAGTQSGAAQGSASRVSRITYPQSRSAVAAKPIHRVRVVRNVDTSLPADRAGRMVVSGRFADVCAELDRLAASEMRVAYSA